jgi:hypothetical protein
MKPYAIPVDMAIFGVVVLLCYIGCRLIWIYTKKLPVWLRLLLRSLLVAVLFSPSVFAGQGGVGFAPAFFYFFMDDRTHVDMLWVAVIPILIGWIVSFVLFGICYYQQKCAKNVENKKNNT